MFKLRISTKILVAFVVIAVISLGLVGYFSYTIGVNTLEQEAFNKLTAIREMKASQIEDYFSFISDQVITLSNDQMIIDAMNDLEESHEYISSDLDVSDNLFGIWKNELRNYYQDEYLPRLSQNLVDEVTVDDYFPTDKEVVLLQSLYISNNPYSTGSKDSLARSGDGSRYDDVHEKYHPIIRDYLDAFGYYDIFLVDVSSGGHIVYSVFKEVDFGTSLLDGPYSTSNIGRAYRAALEADDKDFALLVDYEPYDPSYYAPAAFIATPIFDGFEKTGVLIFQMPIDRINNIMTNNHNWEDVGLGKSGETYLVGEDFLLRNQSRFLIEDSENYFQTIAEIGTPDQIINQIKNLNSTIGLQKVETQGTIAALAGQTNTDIFPDYRGISVFSAYKPLNIAGVNWVIMSEKNESEVFLPIKELQRNLGYGILGLFAVIVLIGILFSRSLTNPITILNDRAKGMTDGDLDSEVDVATDDEIGDLAQSFEIMRVSMKGLISDLEEANADLEHKVEVRTEELALATKRLEKSNERMSEELNFAKEIQMSMLPLIFPAFPTRSEFNIYAHLIPAREVGGDFYDFYFLDEDHLCFVIADVSGKGAPGALLMAVSKTLIKSRAMDDFQPSSILTHINNELSQNNDSAMFITVFLGVLEIQTGRLVYCNAGHNPPFILRKDKTIEKMDDFHGPVIGALPNLTYKESTASLGPEDIITLHTDGITEAMNEEEELYTDNRYENFLKTDGLVTPQKIIDQVIRDVKVFQGSAIQADDITMLSLQYHGASDLKETSRLELKIKNRITELEKVENQFESYCNEYNISDPVRQKVSIVLDELLNNIVNYAFRDQEEHIIDIQFVLTGTRLVITIHDDGVPFNPFELDPPDVSLSLDERSVGGIGILLVRSMMDEFLYSRHIGKNVVRLVKLTDKE